MPAPSTPSTPKPTRTRKPHTLGSHRAQHRAAKYTILESRRRCFSSPVYPVPSTSAQAGIRMSHLSVSKPACPQLPRERRHLRRQHPFPTPLPTEYRQSRQRRRRRSQIPHFKSKRRPRRRRTQRPKPPRPPTPRRRPQISRRRHRTNHRRRTREPLLSRRRSRSRSSAAGGAQTRTLGLFLLLSKFSSSCDVASLAERNSLRSPEPDNIADVRVPVARPECFGAFCAARGGELGPLESFQGGG